MDYVPDPDSWLFAWDDLNPHCSIDGRSPGHSAIPGHTGGGNKGGQKEDLQEGRQGLGKALGKTLWLRTSTVNLLHFFFAFFQ